MKISIPASMAFSSMLRDFIGSLISRDTKFSSKWRHRIQLMADELINNAIEHGSSPGKPVKIAITIYKNDDIEISVEDTWTWIKKTSAEDLIWKAKINREAMTLDPLSNKSIRWRWLAMIVLNWSDDFSYENSPSWWLVAKIFKKFTTDCQETNEEKLKPDFNFLIS